MGANYLSAPVILIINTVFSLYILAVVLRFLLQWAGVGARNPIMSVLINITHPPLKLLRRFIPSIGKIDTSALVLALGLQILADFIVNALQGSMPSFGVLCLFAVASLLSLILDVFFYALLGSVILSWINPGSYHPLANLLDSLCAPILKPCRELLPVMGGIDFSAMLAMLMIQVAKMLLLPPLYELANLIG